MTVLATSWPDAVLSLGGMAWGAFVVWVLFR